MFNLVMGIIMIGIGTICLVKGCIGTLSPVMIFFGCCMIVFGIVEIIRSKAIRKREQQRKASSNGRMWLICSCKHSKFQG